ncbi:hypothetical protein Tco_1546546 [Tanacetum coccineum]
MVKFCTQCTLFWGCCDLERWSYKIFSGPEMAYSIDLEVSKKKMTDKYCPQGEIKKLEIELWNLKVKGNDVPTYTERFQELTLIYTKFVANETEKKLRTYAERQTDNKRKADDSSRNNHGHQQQPFKRQNVAKLGKNRAVPKEWFVLNVELYDHFKMRLSKIEDKEGENGNAQGWVYAVGNAEKNRNASRNPNSNVVTGISPKLTSPTPTPLERISAKKEEDNSEGNQLKDVPIIQDFSEVFPEDLPGLPPARPVEFQIDLIPEPRPYSSTVSIASTKMKGMSE